MGFGTIKERGRFGRVWNEGILKVPLTPNHSMILCLAEEQLEGGRVGSASLGTCDWNTNSSGNIPVSS